VGALYFDLADALSLTDILATGGLLEEAPLDTALARHRSGVRVLAAPRELTPLETISAQDVENLVAALRRNFRITLVDLPTVWTAWTFRCLQLCDRIILVGDLSVVRINLLKRQLRVLEAQRLDTVPITVVCNRVTADKRSLVSIKTAEKALGRDFDAVLPEDALMSTAVARGCELSEVQRGTKLEKAIEKLAEIIEPVPAQAPATRRRLWP
jgi:pilus assembly protein CpaE